MVERAHPLGAETGNLEHLNHARRHFLLQFLQGLGRAGLKDLNDLRGQLLADAGQPGQLFATGDHFLKLRPQSADGAAGIAIGPDLEGVFALDLEVVGNGIKYVGYVGVADRHENKLPCREDGNEPRSRMSYPIATHIKFYFNAGITKRKIFFQAGSTRLKKDLTPDLISA